MSPSLAAEGGASSTARVLLVKHRDHVGCICQGADGRKARPSWLVKSAARIIWFGRRRGNK